MLATGGIVNFPIFAPAHTNDVLLLFHLMPQLAAGARMPPRWCRKSTVSEDPAWSAGVGWCGDELTDIPRTLRPM